MATGDASSPARFLGGQTGVTNRELALDVFGGEVLAAFDLHTVTMDKVSTKTVSGGAKSWKFPKTWKASSEYHSPGVELLGTDIDSTEVTVTADDILVSHFSVSDLDAILSHFDVRSPFSNAAGYELAKVLDKNTFRQIVLAARASADGPFPAGNTAVVGASPTGKDWVDAIRQAEIDLYNKDVPGFETRFMAVPAADFDKIKYATDANGQYLVLNRDFGGQASLNGEMTETLVIEGVNIMRSRNLPSTDEGSDTSVYSKYRADYSGTKAVLWTPSAVGLVKLMSVQFETTRDTRRLEDFTVAKLFCGLGTLRAECAYEFKAA